MKTLQERFDFETKRETEAAKRRIAEELAAAKTNSDNDAREKALAEKAYKEDLLALKRLSELQEREMAQRIKDDYVPKQEFQQLKEMFDAVVEDKRTWRNCSDSRPCIEGEGNEGGQGRGGRWGSESQTT